MAFPFPLFAKFSSLKVLFYISILFIIVTFINTNFNFKRIGSYEGFTQDKSFVLKENNDIYDEFYVEIYDLLNNTIKRSICDIEKIMTTTNLNKETAYVLDIGCGTGCLVNEFLKKDIRIKGIDKSKNMIDYAINKYISSSPFVSSASSIYECSDANDSIIYKRGVFSHILCLYMTIYEIKNKMSFFRNSFYALQPNGFLIVHLIKNNVYQHNNNNHQHDNNNHQHDNNNHQHNNNNDIENDYIENYNGFIDLGKPKAIDETTIIKSGIKKLQIDFGGFLYKKDWSDIYNLKETFIDNSTNNVRQNELMWYYEPMNVILEQCYRCGFALHKTTYQDKSIGGFLCFFIKK